MKRETETTRTRNTVSAAAAPTVAERLSRSVLVGFFTVSALIGIWSIAALAGGLATAGPTAMIVGFFTAVLGV